MFESRNRSTNMYTSSVSGIISGRWRRREPKSRLLRWELRYFVIVPLIAHVMFVNLKDLFPSLSLSYFKYNIMSFLMFKLNVLVSAQRDDGTHKTVGCVVFLMMYFHSLIFGMFDD